jgi:hypothetical protein
MIKPEVRSAVLNKTQQIVQKNKRTKEETDREIKKMRERDAELVTGIFKNLENPAVAGSTGSVTFSYLAYPGDEAVVYELWDGERYQLPRGVARHLNNNCFYREYQQLPGEFGQTGMRGAAPDGRLKTQAMQMSRKVHRFAFHSLEFMEDDTEMRPANIVEVTTTP